MSFQTSSPAPEILSVIHPFLEIFATVGGLGKGRASRVFKPIHPLFPHVVIRYLTKINPDMGILMTEQG